MMTFRRFLAESTGEKAALQRELVAALESLLPFNFKSVRRSMGLIEKALDGEIDVNAKIPWESWGENTRYPIAVAAEVVEGLSKQDKIRVLDMFIEAGAVVNTKILYDCSFGETDMRVDVAEHLMKYGAVPDADFVTTWIHSMLMNEQWGSSGVFDEHLDKIVDIIEKHDIKIRGARIKFGPSIKKLLEDEDNRENYPEEVEKLKKALRKIGAY